MVEGRDYKDVLINPKSNEIQKAVRKHGEHRFVIMPDQAVFAGPSYSHTHDDLATAAKGSIGKYTPGFVNRDSVHVHESGEQAARSNPHVAGWKLPIHSLSGDEWDNFGEPVTEREHGRQHYTPEKEAIDPTKQEMLEQPARRTAPLRSTATTMSTSGMPSISVISICPATRKPARRPKGW